MSWFHRNSPRRKWLRRLSLACSCVSLLSIVVTWAALQRKPAWYRPVALDTAGLEQVRADTANLADRFGDQLVARKPFDFVLHDTDLTAWLTAAPVLWPDAASKWPPELTAPAIRFEPGRIRVAGHLESNGWRIIAGVAVEAAVAHDADSLKLRIANVYGGSLPVPNLLLRKLAAKLAMTDRPADVGDSEAPSFEELFGGWHIQNRFVWPNGKRPFRIARIAFEDGLARLFIEPL